ncbi:subtilisin-like protease SBT5.3 [Papaver somniferum]|uniref:subtilisin-like protease SBT5.3 n=1 Tax=Papaver somniferum TaxID=3469 RepID=UPI000E6F8ACE|nr:subtilisin-like protease SBT5.3 [Papaver somniferum]
MNKLIATTLAVFLFTFVVTNEANSITKKHYIVYMGDHSFSNSNSVISSNHDLLASVTGCSIHQAKEATVHHYSKSFRGFSAILTDDQAQQLRETESVISVFESKINQLHTTHSWDFLGIDDVPQNNANVELKSDVIVGVIDSGVWPESESFNDNGLGPVPKRFKGECVPGDQFTVEHCNRKIIGARYYSQGNEKATGPFESRNLTFFRSARDSDGHGTHVASTVAGSVVNNVSLFGMASGTARGGMPSARLAIYKTCWLGGGCTDADNLAAFDDAISDGVDIISISIAASPDGFFDDPISIGSFHAFKKGILVSTSAGNTGVATTKCAPWLLTVAASSIDREFISNVQLGNSKILKGSSINPLKMDKFHRIIFASDAAAAGVSAGNASSCIEGTLDHKLIKGKIVVCRGNGSGKDIAVRDGGGGGMILFAPSLGLLSDSSPQYVIPTTVLDTKEIQVLRKYATQAKSPIAKIFPSTTAIANNTTRAPKMARFSSIGPNTVTPDIIKPDITAPGVRILGAWTPVGLRAERSVDYNVLSGTSMACPHASAIAAIIKSHHPSWSPSAIKSAIMTTANAMDNTKRPILESPTDSPASPFNYGSGHVNPIAALDPGLVYEFGSNDILNFLCGARANSSQIQMVTGTKITCKNPLIPTYNLNYPSIGVASMNGKVTVKRTVTYVGRGPATFRAFTKNPSGVKVTVKPSVLRFKRTGERKSFRVRFIPSKASNGSFVFGSMSWRSDLYQVRSPIAVNVITV